MTGIRDEVFLNCKPDVAFREFSDVDFTEKIGFGSGLANEILYQNARFIKFNTKTDFYTLESERVLIPEILTVVTQRRNLKVFQYNIIIDSFKSRGSGCIMTHIDEFEMKSPDRKKDNITLNNMKIATGIFLEKIQAYFQ